MSDIISQLEKDGEGNILLKPVIGWDLRPAAEISSSDSVHTESAGIRNRWQNDCVRADATMPRAFGGTDQVSEAPA